MVEERVFLMFSILIMLSCESIMTRHWLFPRMLGEGDQVGKRRLSMVDMSTTWHETLSKEVTVKNFETSYDS